jgi:hypothetical protein
VALRRIYGVVATWWVAVAVILAVPVSQLRTYAIEVTCCCPDPAHCHCPHDPPGSGGTSIRPCHRSSHEVVSPDAPAFTPQEVVALAAPPRTIAPIVAMLPAPHPAPVPTRPDAPS